MKRMRMVKSLGMVIILLSLAAFGVEQFGFAQGIYPEKPITIIMGWTAGGTGDLTARLLAECTSRVLGQPVVVENKPGAHGTIAARDILGAKPDGYTVGGGISSVFVIIPKIRKLPFDLLNDATQILGYYEYDFGVMVRADAPWKTWEEFRENARQHPGKVTYGTAGVGTMQHITFERMAKKDGIKYAHVPFKGGNEPVIAVLGGHVDAALQGSVDCTPNLKNGKLRMLIALNDKRWDTAPNAPTILEKGYGFSTFAIGCMYGQKGLPESIRSKLEDAMHKGMQDPRFIEGAKNMYMKVHFVPGKEYKEMLKARSSEYESIVKDLGLEEK